MKTVIDYGLKLGAVLVMSTATIYGASAMIAPIQSEPAWWAQRGCVHPTTEPTAAYRIHYAFKTKDNRTVSELITETAAGVAAQADATRSPMDLTNDQIRLMLPLGNSRDQQTARLVGVPWGNLGMAVVGCATPGQAGHVRVAFDAYVGYETTADHGQSFLNMDFNNNRKGDVVLGETRSFRFSAPTPDRDRSVDVSHIDVTVDPIR